MTRNDDTPLKDMYRTWQRRLTESSVESFELMRDLYDQWDQLATEADGVTFQTVDENGISGLWAIPKGAHPNAAILYLHGGGYLGGSSRGHRKLVAHIAKAAGVRAFCLDYRLAPEHRYPAQLEDSRSAFDWLVEGGFSSDRIGLIGDSAGGALATAVALHLKDSGSPQAGAIVALSPFYDLETTGASFDYNADNDVLGSREGVVEAVPAFLGPDVTLANPYINALHSDPTGLPPVFVSIGGAEVLLDGARAFVELARSRGVEAHIEVAPDQQHVFHVLAGVTQEADAAIAAIGQHFRRHLCG